MSEKVLFDANSFIDPYKRYYGLDIVPSYWKYLLTIAPQVVLLDKVYEEILKGEDLLADWLGQHESDFCILSTAEETVLGAYGQVIQYLDESPLYQEQAVRSWSDFQVADPWLIAAAKIYGYIIITFETGDLPNRGSPSKRPKIPVVGASFGVKCESLFSYLRRMKMVL